jgi:hypothetical protein
MRSPASPFTDPGQVRGPLYVSVGRLARRTSAAATSLAADNSPVRTPAAIARAVSRVVTKASLVFPVARRAALTDARPHVLGTFRGAGRSPGGGPGI